MFVCFMQDECLFRHKAGDTVLAELLTGCCVITDVLSSLIHQLESSGEGRSLAAFIMFRYRHLVIDTIVEPHAWKDRIYLTMWTRMLITHSICNIVPAVYKMNTCSRVL